MLSTPREILAAHAKTHKLTPGQQVNLLTYYLGLKQMFPEIPLLMFLERTLTVAGATKENRQFPKDALDHHCPNKDSQWKPGERIDIMLIFLEANELLDQETPPQPPLQFDAFLADEAAPYKAEGPTEPIEVEAAPAADMTQVPKQPRQRQRKTEVAVAKPVQCAGRAVYRMPVGDGAQGPERLGVVQSIYERDGMQVADFLTDAGERMEGIPVLHLSEPPQAPPPPAAKTADYKLIVPQVNMTKAENFLSLMVPAGSVALGTPLQEFELALGEVGTAIFQIVNANPRPYVDAFVVKGTSSVPISQELLPRENALRGQYTFQIGAQSIVVDVTSRG